MEPSYLGLSLVGWNVMFDSWWDKFLAFFIGTTVVLGSLYILFRVYCNVVQYWRRRRQQVSIPMSVSRYLKRLITKAKKLPVQRGPKDELKSFGVFLGSFNNPPTLAQNRLLSQWDVLVLDPLKEGVLNALSTCQPTSSHILGRLDIGALVKPDCRSHTDKVLQSLGTVAHNLTTYFKSPFTGVLLADCYQHFQPLVLNDVARYINGLGLDVWLELSGPDYLTERQARDINMKLIRGIVYRNGTIRFDGDRQNYFQMAEMRTAMQTIAAQRVTHGPPQFMWETINDGIEMQYAVIQRSFTWCRFNSAMCWIGHAAALNDAEAAITQAVIKKPLGALTWLKDENVIKAHDTWRLNGEISQFSCSHDDLYDTLEAFVPNLSARLTLSPPNNNKNAENQLSIADHFNLGREAQNHLLTNPLSVSSGGLTFTGLGCFQLGLEVTRGNFEDLVRVQRNLKDLDLLQRVDEEELQQIRARVKALHEAQSQSLDPLHSPVSQSVKNLLDLLSSNDDDINRLQIYVGLHSGFQTSSGAQFWGLYNVDTDSGVLNIYLSGKTQDRASTILHTFLSSQELSRTECLMAELAMSEQNGSLSERWELPPRMVRDVETLSPMETILFLRRITPSKSEDDSSMLKKIRICGEYQLLEVPTHTQLRAMSATAYLSGSISAEDLVIARIEWLQEKGCWHPDLSAAVNLFEEIDARLHDVLMNGENELLAQLCIVIRTILQKSHIDAGADIFALAVFSAFRKLALDEVYLEVLDRNPLPNHATDQAGCFAENMVLGSRCDSFFDMTARELGRILSDRYRVYYTKHQPPMTERISPELPTAYAAMQIDSDPNQGSEKLPWYHQLTFLGIFALPALIDVMLLTITGRGLYLTAYMTSTERTMATTALLLALLITGATSSWITSGGSYYFYANAFPAMNMFVLTRFVAGIAIALVGGLGGMIVAMIVKGPIAGLVFFFYFVMLTTYLLTLAVLSIYQLPGNQFQSGRTVILTCIPILFISPVLTIWIQHDIEVYLCVLTLFLISLLLGARKIISQWSTFYLQIPSVTDVEILDWYTKRRGARRASVDLPEGMYDEEITPQARREIHAAVLKQRNRPFWMFFRKDPLIAKLANGYSSTMFLMGWYCKFKRAKMPLPYSTAWNLTVSAAIETMTNMQKGLKLHSAFLHWRHTGADIWSGVLYFVVALLDKWTALFTNDGLVGLSAAANTEYHLAVGFGLSYYLLGAVFLDAISLPLWTAANEKLIQPINSLGFLRQAIINDQRARRALYWKNLTKFFFLHIWGITITSALMWLFESSRNATFVFLAYVGAYSGLLLYQYNKIYCGNDGGKSLGLAILFGFPAEIALRYCLPHFTYAGVIGLAVGTWIAAFHSMRISKIGWPSFTRSKSKGQTGFENHEDAKATPVSYSCSTLDHYPDLSQKTISKIFNAVGALPAEQRFQLDPWQHPSDRIIDILESRSKAKRVEILQIAFPSAEQLVQQTVELWQSGKIVIELVSARHFPQYDQKIRAVSRKLDDMLHIFIILGNDQAGHKNTLNIRRNYKIIAEAIVQASCEAQFGLSHDHSMLAELLVVDHSGDQKLSIPEGIKRELETSTTERTWIIENGDKILLRYLLLGLDCEREWGNLPIAVRSFLLKRICGQYDPISSDVESWVRSQFCINDCLDIKEYIARCNLGATLTLSVSSYAKTLEVQRTGYVDQSSDLGGEKWLGSPPPAIAKASDSVFGPSKYFFSQVLRKVQKWIKFFILSLTADPEYQRELDYVMRGKHHFLRWSVTIFLNGLWSFCKILQGIVIPTVLFYGRENVSRLHDNVKGMKTVIEKKRIVIESLSGPSTCFVATQPDGTLRLSQYAGRHEKEPSKPRQLMAINNYTKKLVLCRREEYHDAEIVNVFSYEYPEGETKGTKLPMQRECIEGDLNGQIIHYDERGYITTGSTFRSEFPVEFTFWYRKSAKFQDELLRGEYIMPHITISVNWSMPPRDNPHQMDDWIPFSKVTEATFVQGQDVFHATWDYELKFHPEITTTLNGKRVENPPVIVQDWYEVLKKPGKCDFLSDNPLLSFSSPKSNFVTRLLGLNVKRYPISTSHARTHLWESWRGSIELDAITARWIDERLLRSDEILNTYWRNRDLGLLDSAKEFLDTHTDTIMARVDLDQLISSWTHIAFKMSDLYSFGQGGDSRINTRKLQGQVQDSQHELHVLAMDTSTWPNDPGGVSACRRDMVDDLRTIKWHIVAESAHDYGVPKFQIEKNVQSLTILPLWGLDFLNPTHGILEGSLDSAVVERTYHTRAADIKEHFIPILTSLVKLSRTRRLGRKHIEEATNALVDLNTYFETSRSWNDVWTNEVVKQAWRELWLTEDIEDTLPVSQWWDFERPTIAQLDTALNMWQRYLFIFSIPVPEKIPDVFQASHHFTGATYGILCKVKRKCSLHIWDHSIAYRELTVFMSSAVSFDTPFINSSLISLSHLSCVLLQHHADVVLPCAEYFNPGWEIELGTSENDLEHRRVFERKIDPVVNGITKMEKFQPTETIKTDKPTVVMLSHIQYPKDIKSAIMSVDFIVNRWGFTDYVLHIYGNMERFASYTTECQELIEFKGLREHCILKGLGKPSVVLQDAWLFLNSSTSEGLPLAMGEAALTGVPVVCTDVGASFCVVTDRETGDRFSEVVPPNDPESLARAQINILGLLGRWSTFAEDAPGTEVPVLSYPDPTPQQVQQIARRIYDKSKHRRALGMLGRENVLKNFSSDRYLREHEQMLWIGKYRSRSYNEQSTIRTSTADSFNEWFTEKSNSTANLIGKKRRKPRLEVESWVSLPRPVSLVSTSRRASLLPTPTPGSFLSSSRRESLLPSPTPVSMLSMSRPVPLQSPSPVSMLSTPRPGSLLSTPKGSNVEINAEASILGDMN